MYVVTYVDRNEERRACMDAQHFGGTCKGLFGTHQDAISFRNHRIESEALDERTTFRIRPATQEEIESDSAPYTLQDIES